MVFAFPRPSSSEIVNDWADESIGKAVDIPAGTVPLRTDARVPLIANDAKGRFLESA